MNALEVAQRSIDAWNRHDADALVAVYAEGGTYHNPRFDHPLTGQALADFAKALWVAYPDMSLEVISMGDTGGGLVASLQSLK
jgi:SnoaL-like domain